MFSDLSLAGRSSVFRPQLVGVGSIVVRHHDCIGVDPNVSFPPEKVSLGQVLRIPTLRRRRQPFSQLIDRSLGKKCHCRLPVTNVEIASPGPVPAKRLMGVEELLHMPPLGEILS
jgi:hypothetical protein